MAQKRKMGVERPRHPGGARTGQVRRRGAERAGHVVTRRGSATFHIATAAAVEEHISQVRQKIESALAEGRRLREEIEKRIDRHIAELGQALPVTKALTRPPLQSASPATPE